MDALREFVIPIKGLADGIHNYIFLVQDSFFSAFEKSLVKNGEIRVELELDKRPSLLVLNFVLTGEIKAPCDRCLSLIHIPVKGQREYMVKYNEDAVEDDDVLYISELDSGLNVSQLVYEFIHLNLPLVNLRDCERENHIFCNSEVLKKLDREVSNDEGSNPIWDALKDINIKE